MALHPGAQEGATQKPGLVHSPPGPAQSHLSEVLPHAFSRELPEKLAWARSRQRRRGALGTSASQPPSPGSMCVYGLVVPASLCQVSRPRGAKGWVQAGLFYPDNAMGWGLTTGVPLTHDTVTKHAVGPQAGALPRHGSACSGSSALRQRVGALPADRNEGGWVQVNAFSALWHGPWGPGCHAVHCRQTWWRLRGHGCCMTPGPRSGHLRERLWDVASARAPHLPTSPCGPSRTKFISSCGCN